LQEYELWSTTFVAPEKTSLFAYHLFLFLIFDLFIVQEILVL